MSPHSSRHQRVRELVLAEFCTLGCPSPDSQPMRESFLIREGCYCGHRFCLGPLVAVWFFEEDQLKVYRADGGLAQVLQLDAQPSEARAA